jgi:lysozyme
MADSKPPLLGAAPPTRVTATGGALIGIMGLAAASLLTPLVQGFEDGPAGPALRPYKDIVGVWTQCSGETLNVTAASPTETVQGCKIKLDKRLASFAQGVVKCTPSLRGRDYQWAAATSLAYNIGVAGWCSSTADRMFDAGRSREACAAFLLWDKAKGRRVAGLARRRRAESALCLTGLPA